CALPISMHLRCVQNVVLHCLVEICMDFHGKDVVLCCSKISMYFPALMVPSQKCKLPLPRALTQPHTMTDPGFGICCWKQSVWSFSSLVRSTWSPFLPKKT